MVLQPDSSIPCLLLSYTHAYIAPSILLVSLSPLELFSTPRTSYHTRPVTHTDIPAFCYQVASVLSLPQGISRREQTATNGENILEAQIDVSYRKRWMVAGASRIGMGLTTNGEYAEYSPFEHSLAGMTLLGRGSEGSRSSLYAIVTRRATC